jgi:hypothetical protein
MDERHAHWWTAIDTMIVLSLIVICLGIWMMAYDLNRSSVTRSRDQIPISVAEPPPCVTETAATATRDGPPEQPPRQHLPLGALGAGRLCVESPSG